MLKKHQQPSMILTFIDQDGNEKKNPLSKNEDNLIFGEAQAIIKKIRKNIFIECVKKDSRQYTVTIYDDQDNVLSSKQGDRYVGLIKKAIQGACKSINSGRRRNRRAA